MENLLFEYIEKYMKLSEEEKQFIRDLSVFKCFAKDDILLKEGQRSDESFFVVKGCIRCYYMINGEEKTTAFYTEGDTFAPVSSVNNVPSEQFVACVEDSILAVSRPEMEQASFVKFPRFETLCRLIAEDKLAKQQASFDDFKTSSPEQRYLKLLAMRPDLVQRVPQYQLASYLGIAPQSLSRLRGRLVKKTEFSSDMN